MAIARALARDSQVEDDLGAELGEVEVLGHGWQPWEDAHHGVHRAGRAAKAAAEVSQGARHDSAIKTCGRWLETDRNGRLIMLYHVFMCLLSRFVLVFLSSF